MKAPRIVLVIVLVMMSVLVVTSADTTKAQTVSSGCMALNDSFWDSGIWGSIGWIETLDLYAGEVVVATVGPPEVGSPTTIEFLLDGNPVASAPYPGTLTYAVPQNMTVSYMSFQVIGVRAGATYDVSCMVPGCDVQISIPSTAVGGAFVADAETYWAPGQKTDPVVTITMGNTARVLGVDASGAYYKIIWECQYLWVPIGTMGPNYDEVWNGAPLPTEVVE